MAGTRSSRARRIDGIVVLNKPAGMTSNAALQRVKRLLRAKKAGHTGSLDPAATGMLPLCFGEATKASAWLLEADKTYRVVARLGVGTDTGDADGSVIETAAVPSLTGDEWRERLEAFVGDSEQVPPMYSALKKDGKRLYELARQGETVEREARQIAISAIDLLEIAGTRLVFRVTCSKGTYIRTLVEDIALSVGTVAHTRRLHRESVAGFAGAEMLSLGKVERNVESGVSASEWLMPPDEALAWMPAAMLPAAEAVERFLQGQVVPCEAGDEGQLTRVYGPGRKFLGVGELETASSVAPKRIFLLAGDGLEEGENGAATAGCGAA